MAVPRVLVVTATAGHGHARAAKALAAALRTRHPALDVAEVDVLEKMPRWFAKTYRGGYLRLVDRHPHLWRLTYERTDRETPWVGSWLSARAGQGFLREALAWKPDLVVSTHFLPPELFGWARRRGRTEVPVQTVVTDHDVHRSWWQRDIDAYYVASDAVRARLTYRYGVPAERVHVTGIPIDASFRGKRDLVSIRASLGIDPQRPTVMFTSAGFALGPVADSIRGIWRDRPDAQVLALCGKNVRFARRLADLARPENAVLHALGFRDDVADLMSISDVVVGKSGGLTTAECAALGRPLIVSHAIAGQEERNADAILAAGAGVKAPTPEEVRWYVARLLSHPDELRAMSARAKAFGRPHAADDVADRVADRVGLHPVLPPPAHGAPRAVPRSAMAPR